MPISKTSRDPSKRTRYKSRLRISLGAKIYGKKKKKKKQHGESHEDRELSPALVVRHTLTFLTYILPSCCNPTSCPSDVQALSRVPRQRFPRKKLGTFCPSPKDLYCFSRASSRSSGLTFLLEITKNVPEQFTSLLTTCLSVLTYQP